MSYETSVLKMDLVKVIKRLGIQGKMHKRNTKQEKKYKNLPK